MGKISALSNKTKQNMTYEEHVDRIMSRDVSAKKSGEINEDLLMELQLEQLLA